jgi:hypothetical protein
MRIILIMLCLITTVSAQPTSFEAVESEIDDILTTFKKMGKKDFESKWPNGETKEKYTVDKEGKVSYTKFFPAGNLATSYQATAGGTVTYEKKYGSGKDALLIKSDGRTMDYTSYWPNGRKKAKYQRNRLTKERFLVSNDENGKQVYPASK